MVLPRMAALAEVVWSPKEARNYEDFAGRLETQFERYGAMGAKYHPGADQIEFTVTYDSVNRTFGVALATEFSGGEMHYTTDGSEPTMQSPVYGEPIRIDTATTVRVIVGKDGKQISKSVSERLIGMHKGIGKAVRYNSLPSPAYAGSLNTLVDGLTGSVSIKDGYYQGFNIEDFDVVVDLGEKTKFTEVTGSFLQTAGSWVYLPVEMVVSVSDDGENFREAGKAVQQVDPHKSPEIRYAFTVRGNFDARYVRVVGVNGVTPSGLQGAGHKNWIFADEIFIK